jgi:hypothetical protein
MRDLNTCEIEAVNGGQNILVEGVIWTWNFWNDKFFN